MRNGEPQIYTALALMRNGYTTMQWSRIQMALVFNVVAVPLVMGSGQTEAVKGILSAAAVLVHLALMNATIRADGWIAFIDRRLSDLEELDAGQDSGLRTLVFSHPQFTARRQSPGATRRFLRPVGIAVIILWIEEILRHLYLLLR